MNLRAAITQWIAKANAAGINPVALGLCALVLILAVLAFSNIGAPSRVTIVDTSILSAFTLTGSISIPVEQASVRFTSGEPILLATSGRVMNATGTILLEDFTGKMAWDGKRLTLKGTMRSAHGSGLDVTWELPEHTVITLASGIIDALATNITSLSRRATGPATLQQRYTAQFNGTALTLKDFSGRAYLQRAGNTTTLGLQGKVGVMHIEEDNLLDILS